jgi:hypothetical protein
LWWWLECAHGGKDNRLADAVDGATDAAIQVEVDDYRDYEKALGALNESLKYATMSQTPQGAR